MSGLLGGITSGWDQLGTKINRVGAGAAALAGLHPLEYDPEDKWNIALDTETTWVRTHSHWVPSTDLMNIR